MSESAEDTQNRAYTERLIRIQKAPWKRWLKMQLPNLWNLRRLKPGYTLEIGSGIGRNLIHLGQNGVGIDHNPYSVAHARSLGLVSFTPSEFESSPVATGAPRFDSLLLSHLLEHLSESDAAELLKKYLPFLRSGGRVICICPQELGYASDPSHLVFFDSSRIERLLTLVGCTIEKSYSYPFPRWAGKLFIYNEFVVVGRIKT